MLCATSFWMFSVLMYLRCKYSCKTKISRWSYPCVCGMWCYMKQDLGLISCCNKHMLSETDHKMWCLDERKLICFITLLLSEKRPCVKEKSHRSVLHVVTFPTCGYMWTILVIFPNTYSIDIYNDKFHKIKIITIHFTTVYFMFCETNLSFPVAPFTSMDK